eukprot:gene6976-9579_t
MSIWDKTRGKFDPNLGSDELVFLQQRRYTDVRRKATMYSREMVELDEDHEPDGQNVVRLNELYASDDEDEDGSKRNRHRLKETDVDRPTLKLQPAATLTLPRSYTSNITYRHLKRTMCCSLRGVTWISGWQGQLQARICPGNWIPGVRALHSHREDWILSDCDAELAYNCTLSSFRGLPVENGHQHVIAKADPKNYVLEMHVYTRAEWLDIIHIKFHKAVFKHIIAPMGGCIASVVSTSSGVIPCFIPLAPLLNTFLCWAPFSDRQSNKKRVSLLRLRLSQVVQLRRSYA